MTDSPEAPFARYDNGAPNPAYHERHAVDLLDLAVKMDSEAATSLNAAARVAAADRATARAQAHATLAVALRIGEQR